MLAPTLHFEGRVCVFPDTKKRAKGITKFITKKFAPTYKYNKLQKRPKNVGGLSKRQARNRGKLVDRQLTRYIHSKKTTAYFCTPTNNLLAFFRDNHITLTHSQFTVGYSKWRLATLVDLVAKTSSGKTLLIEVKTGCHYRRCTTGGYLKHITPQTSDSKVHQHQLQILMCKRLFIKNFPCLPPPDTLLIYTTEQDGVVEAIYEKDFHVSLDDDVIERLT